MQNTLSNLKELVVLAEDEIEKVLKGNKAAGTRVRKIMQDIKTHANDIRKQILESRTEKAAK